MSAKKHVTRFDHAWQLIERWVADDEVNAIAVGVGDHAGLNDRRQSGYQRLDRSQPLVEEPIFLIASPSKPVTALAVMLLVEQGELKLHDPISRYLSEFTGGGKRRITLGHCLTHTSGLPDMVAENLELRRQQAPLDAFFAATCRAPLSFKPGEGVQYQSSGLLAAARVVEKLVGEPLREFLKRRVFDPLGMTDTSMGMTDAWTQDEGSAPPRVERIVEVRAPAELADPQWGWNSEYWRRLGAPWGGLLATVTDWSKLCAHLMQVQRGDEGVIRASTLAAMTANQLETLRGISADDRRCKPWGLGWQLNWPGDPLECFGDLLSPAAYGHWGMTGTMVWIDPARDRFCVALSSQPLEVTPRRQTNLSNAICAAR